MTNAEKINLIETILTDGGDVPSSTTLNAYVDISGREILSWMYHQIGGIPSDCTAVPERYEMIQVYAVVAGYTQAGAEGQSGHTENGVARTFRYSDMLDYIHRNILPYARVGAVSAE